LRYVKAAVLAIAAVLLAGVLAQPARAEFSFDFAYSNLSQHGSWLVSAQYGRVWQPRVYNREWNPYYDGHWVYSDMGWTWVSDYEWGSIPYHYGTWVADPDAGWVWIPGNVWAPSWVVFRTGPDYIGWAPVPPGFSVGMSIDMGGASNFVFVSSHDFLAPRVRTSIIPMARANLFINNTTVVNNIVIQNNVVVNRGPDFRTVERATGRTIHEERIETVARVAPFDHVDRTQLAVDPERVRRGVRVAEPVPESRPLPVSDKRGNRGRSNTTPADASGPLDRRPAARPNTQEPSTPPAAVTPSGAADTGQKARRAQTPPRDPAAAPSTVDKDKPNTGQTAKAQPKAKVRANAKAKKGKKNNPDKKDQSSDQGTTPEAKKETPR